jgi:class 3 adenylate cyclase
VILAASRPERVHSLFWFSPKGRSTRAPDYPWGYTPAEVEADRRVTAAWGSDAYGRLFIQLEAAAQGHVIDDGDADLVTKMSRRTCTPDAARQAAEIWFETDVRGVLPAVQASVLLIDTRNAREGAAEAAYIASLMPHAEVLAFPGDDPGAEHLAAIRRLVGANRAQPDLDRMLATVLFTDIVESTARAAALGDAGWRRLLERHDAIVRLCLAKYQGREIKTLGDGILAIFDGPSRGVRCAQEIVEAAGYIGIEIRAGLHTGEIERTNDDIAGIAVAIAARVAVSARPSEVLVSQTIKDLTAGSGIVYSDRDEHELKGVPDRWRLYAAAG